MPRILSFQGSQPRLSQGVEIGCGEIDGWVSQARDASGGSDELNRLGDRNEQLGENLSGHWPEKTTKGVVPALGESGVH
jgi:hypothetical protein